MGSDLGYKNKRVVVSGCFSGIGRATAQLLLDHGAEVHGLDLKSNDLNLHSFTSLDLRDPRSIEAAVKTMGGRVDALFNCAGVPPGRDPIDVLKVNFIGTRLLTEQVLERMPDGGAVANVASQGGAGWDRRLPTLLQFAETTSFDAAIVWCRDHGESLAASMNCISPGAVQTPMLDEIETVTPTAVIDVTAQPFGRRSQPNEQAYPLLMLNSEHASYINGAVLSVDGGFLAARTTGQIAAPAVLGRK
jgi:NAD(P)-dependent dehydrogenase (short-subunit alcohol dehydrogenase family)